MARRQQKLSRAKSRTAWLAWAAWGVFGSIFLFEDTMGGSGVFAWILTAPFWIMFVVWPFLWVWLKTRRSPELVEIDDDIVAGDVKCRMVQKEGVRYVERDSFEKAFDLVSERPFVKIPGGDEDFIAVKDIEPLAAKSEALKKWLAQLATIADPR